MDPRSILSGRILNRSILDRGVASGLRLGRGTADRVVRIAGPTVGRVTDAVLVKVRRPAPHRTTTFTPSRRPPTDPVAEPSPGSDAQPSPATVARNIGPQRPTARPARKAKPKSGPGAKLPPPRPSTS